MANALEYLLNVFHKAVVKDGLSQTDVTEVALTFSRLATGLADLVWSGDTKTEVVRSSRGGFGPIGIVEAGLCDFCH